MEKYTLPAAVDLSHHLSDLAKRRQPSPLKVMFKYIEQPGIISLAGGVPNPEYFPFDSISGQALLPTTFSPDNKGAASERSAFSWLWEIFGIGHPKTHEITVPKYSSDTTAADPVQLSVALQYGAAVGLKSLQTFVRNFTEKVYQPGYSNWTTFAQIGNTDGWAKIVATLCNSGECILTEEWTYPSALATAWPLGVKAVGVAMDGEGMRADALEELLANWDESAHEGMKRPHVMYTVPVGQNPTGSTMGAERKKAIYAVCVKYDIIIVEDDPYYFLQVGDYVPKHRRTNAFSSENSEEEERAFLNSLAPTFLRFDYQGRVVRLDTFSKTVAPGSRLGWFTCNALFAERLERIAETSTQAPCGFGQALVTQLLAFEWGYSGYIRWLRGLRAQYKARRDFMVDCFSEEFHLAEKVDFTNPFSSGALVMSAREKSRGGWGDMLMREKRLADDEKFIFSFVAPTAGMFVWVKIDLSHHPLYDPNSPPKEDQDSLEFVLWENLAKAGLLIGPGFIFSPEFTPLVKIQDATARRSLSEERLRYAHFRISYSDSDFDTTRKAIKIFATVLHEFFKAPETLLISV